MAVETSPPFATQDRQVGKSNQSNFILIFKSNVYMRYELRKE